MKKLLQLLLFAVLLLTNTKNIYSQCDVDGIFIDAALLDPNSGSNNFDTDQDGTAEDADEFVQICNNTGSAIDLSTYTFGDDETATANISLSGTIPANGCVVLMDNYTGTPPPNFLILPANSMALANGGEPLILINTATGNGCEVAFGTGCTTSFTCVVWPEDTDGVVTAGGVANSNITPNDLGMASLPVEFSRFSAKENGKQIDLLWSTASELNNDRFDIMRSADGRSYDMIGSVAGQGTSLKNNDYSFVDEQPLAGTNYYKLKQVDFDGRVDYSDVVVVSYGKETNIRINPTTTSDYFTISTGSPSSVSIINTSGQVVAQQANDEGNFTFDMQHLPDGLHFVTVSSDGSVETRKVIKN